MPGEIGIRKPMLGNFLRGNLAPDFPPKSTTTVKIPLTPCLSGHGARGIYCTHFEFEVIRGSQERLADVENVISHTFKVCEHFCIEDGSLIGTGTRTHPF